MDDEKSIVKAAHKFAKYTYWTVFTVGILVSGWLLFNKYSNSGILRENL